VIISIARSLLATASASPAPSPGKAIHLRQRLYKLRQLEKIESTKLFEVGDERRNVTPYDNLEAVLVGSTVEIRPTEPLVIEEL
jgi:hypothetical protein